MRNILLSFFLVSLFIFPSAAQESAKEEDFFKIHKVRSPEGNILEVGGLCTLPNGDLAVTTRRGDVFIVENPSAQNLISGNLLPGFMKSWGGT